MIWLVPVRQGLAFNAPRRLIAGTLELHVNLTWNSRFPDNGTETRFGTGHCVRYRVTYPHPFISLPSTE